MSMTGDFKELQGLQKVLTDFAEGKAAEEVRQALADKALELAQESFRARRSPYGQPWRGNRGAVSLEQTGRLRRSVRIEQTHKGFVLVADGPFFKRSHGHDITEAVVHNWGGTVRARFKGSRSRSVRKQMALADQQGRNTAQMAKFRGAKPMRFRVDGRWVSTYAFTIRSNPILPAPGRLPSSWGSALDGAAQEALNRIAKAAGP